MIWENTLLQEAQLTRLTGMAAWTLFFDPRGRPRGRPRGLLLESRRRLPPDRELSDRKRSGVKGRKVSLTYAFTANADGSEKLDPLIIGKAYKPHAFRNKTGAQLGFYYRNNAKAWMTTVIYQEWIRDWDAKLKRDGRKILLLQDNFSTHIVPADVENIRVVPFAPNLTAHVQPMDAGIIRCHKAHYCREYIGRAIDRYECGATPGSIYDINQLEAMRLADAAWDEVTPKTIANCWRKSGILPQSLLQPKPPSVPISSLLNFGDIFEDDGDENPTAAAEREVEEVLDQLVSTGALQKSNRMDINDLLNPEEEIFDTDQTSDQAIFDAVMSSAVAREGADADGCSNDAEDDTPLPDPLPTHSDVLKAMSLVTQYTNSLDDALARKAEGVLKALQHQIRTEQAATFRESKITDFFNWN